MEKRIIHNSASGEPILSLPAEPESAPSEESEVPIPTNIPTAEMSAEEIRQLDELMRNQVNEMLQDILAERRRTTGLWDEEIDGKGDVKSVIAEETDSEDSFEEKYVRYSGETEKMAKKAETEEVAKETETEEVAKETETEDELYADSEVEEENEEVNNGENEEKTEENDVKIEEKEEKQDMCKAIDDMMNDARMSGEALGEARGEARGREAERKIMQKELDEKQNRLDKYEKEIEELKRQLAERQTA